LRASRDARGIITVLADGVHISHFDFGNGSSRDIRYLIPELPDNRLGLRVGHPVVADVLVLASNLTVVTSVAL
jgi:hypothetical protein